MKRLSYVFAFLIVIFSLVFSTSFADEKVIEESFVLDGKNVKLPITKVKLDGVELKGDVPPVILNDRTLVPVRLISENLGAKVTWDSKEYKVHINKDNKEIVLKIDSYKADVDGKEYILPDKVPAKLVSDRTMVPVRFVSEQLGVNVDWDSVNRVVILENKKEEENYISLEDVEIKSDEIKLILSDKASYKDILLVNPDRLVIDLENTKMNTLKDKYEGLGALISGVRVSQFEENPLVARVVVDTKYSPKYDITQNDNEIIIKFDVADNFANFEFKKTDDKESFIIERDIKSEYKSFYLKNPNRLVVDLYYTTLEIENDDELIEEEINKDYINGYKAYYYKEEERTRLVLNLNSDISIDEYEKNVKFLEEENDIKILFNFFNIENENLKYEFKNNSSILTIIQDSDKEAEDIDYDDWSNKIKVKIKNRYVDLDDEEVKIDDEYVEKIEVDKSSKYTYIDIKLKNNVLFNILKRGEDKIIEIKLYKQGQINNGKRLVVIDPGHGGSDPGAISPIDKTKEKDLTLEISKKLNEKLKENGYDTVMTRDKDTYPALRERTDLANEVEGNIFVSIHINAVDNTAIHGIQTLYYPNDGEYANGRDNETFAKIIQEELLKSTNAVDRKKVKRPNLVVIKYTKMPAVLIECGFLTNNDELKLMKSPEYQDKLVEGIYNGIERYFEEKGE
ncbi:N-acetylmuramoyl-L-alanine amidase [Tepidibacter formicigenes]|jgi:N-acetylmuramoyl-L-alanine amidase|uniref:N-acetylmuramoyl-L-alanine amidase n=1 Tax=Tepidibacter formicigenes DSM 15518 TaxID=1123349 RepID=A0A1M6MEW3_9FIRM|nr:N-acetylmuramoyl-L-alanine amidase [Tepidibacter formicigenes]SHJ81977.1 N-acetylmuramoyl-L-alanine amidase [Tepidibacter formicigenes DSM 15518]